MSHNMIEVKGLTKIYSEHKVVDSIDFSIKNGKIYAIVGRNGAGKSTVLKILTTVLKPSSGEVILDGVDVVKEPLVARFKFGYVPQGGSVDEKLTGKENLYIQAKLYHMDAHSIKSKVDEVLHLTNLEKDSDRIVSEYSGGMKKRLEIACALINVPKILFLDEPTVALDVESRKEIWNYIKKLNKQLGMTVFLTTHYLDELEDVCDELIIMDDGKIVVSDTPMNLKRTIGEEIIEIVLGENFVNEYEVISQKLESENFIKGIKNIDKKVILALEDAGKFISEIYKIISDLGIEVHSISMKKVTLEDVYLSYVGRQFNYFDSDVRRR
ncbi:ABC transporter ATP-binding protein [Streptococcus pseudoporcinus]|uniref:ABC transporter ATP-binding protein n=1 Tax=Streptococcus pseudoporcinus TaxID=361101 RepID=A0A4U9YSI6_9STRE|nr:ABC transporter ATP-binding protein [Streptococcus pseudoporcinus]VTS30015.1 ABC transporter ATP-binding protein [Streptococcus pseudoporcinus]